MYVCGNEGLKVETTFYLKESQPRKTSNPPSRYFNLILFHYADGPISNAGVLREYIQRCTHPPDFRF